MFGKRYKTKVKLKEEHPMQGIRDEAGRWSSSILEKDFQTRKEEDVKRYLSLLKPLEEICKGELNAV